jgi:hypothetical protein
MTEEFLRKMRRASAEEIDQAVRDYLKRRARYHATVIARHETNEANRTARKKAAGQKPWVKGMKWNLSHSHPAEDICDEYATQNKFKLGPGVYPVKEYPETPHPNCLCYDTEVVDPEWFTDDVKRRIKKDAESVGAA